MLLIKVEIPPGIDSKCFKHLKISFLVNDPKDLTRTKVIDFLNKKKSKLEQEEDRNDFGINNVIACLNFLNTYVPEEKWIYICPGKTKGSIFISSESSTFIKFSVLDFEDLRDQTNV
jgi:hypothetical protein